MNFMMRIIMCGDTKSSVVTVTICPAKVCQMSINSYQFEEYDKDINKTVAYFTSNGELVTKEKSLGTSLCLFVDKNSPEWSIWLEELASYWLCDICGDIVMVEFNPWM